MQEEPRILVMGPDRNYLEAITNREYVRKVATDPKRGELLKELGNPEKSYDPHNLTPYGGSETIDASKGQGGNLLDGLAVLFEIALKKARYYKADYVLLQNLDRKQCHRGYEVKASAQLLLE